MLELRLELAGLDGDERLGPAAVRRVRGLGRVAARAARSSGSSPSSTRATCASSSTRRRRPTSCATTGCGASGRRCRAGAGWRSSTAPGTAACWSSASRASPTDERVAARLRRDQRLRADARRRGHGARQVLAAHLRRGAARALRGARGRPAEALEAHRRGLAQPRASAPPTSEAVEDMLERTEHRAARRGTSSRPTPSATPA